MRRLALLLALVSVIPGAATAAGSAGSLDERRRSLEALTAAEDALETRIGADRTALSEVLAALALFGRDPPPPLIVSAKDAKDAVRSMILAKAMAAELQARVRSLQANAATLAGLRRKAAEASGDLFETESEIQDRQGRLDAVTQDAALLAPPGARKAVAAQDLQPAPINLVPPVAGTISTRFGGRLQTGLAARGVAYRPGLGAPVAAPADAVVAYAGPVNGWGQVVILRAGGGCHMVLSGLGKVTVTAGQSVAAASQIGSMPTSGQPPPELYFEVRLARGPIDPAKLLAGDRAGNVKAGALRLRREGVD